MPQSLTELEATRIRILKEFLTLGDLRPGTVSGAARRCGKPSCHCAQPDGVGHRQFRLLHKVKGKTVAESFATPAAFQQATAQVTEYHRLQDLVTELTAVNEQICRLRPVKPDEKGWTEEEKKRLLLFIRKSRGKFRRFSG